MARRPPQEAFRGKRGPVGVLDTVVTSERVGVVCGTTAEVILSKMSGSMGLGIDRWLEGCGEEVSRQLQPSRALQAVSLESSRSEVG